MNRLVRDLKPRLRIKLKPTASVFGRGGMIEGRTQFGKLSLARLVTRGGLRGS